MAPLAIAAAAVVVAGTAAAAVRSPEIHMPYPWAGPEVALGRSIFVLDQQASLKQPGAELLKLNPRTNRIVRRLRLRSTPASGPAGPNAHIIAVKDGMIWLTVYDRDELLRINPKRMRITRRIRVGRGPGSIVAADGLLWVALQYGRGLERVNPTNGRLLGRVRVGHQRNSKDGPDQLAFDGKHLFATLPASGRVAVIDPRTRRVYYDEVKPAMACSRVLPVRGGFWLDDTECSDAYYRWSSSRHRITATVAPGVADYGAVVAGGYLYTAQDDCYAAGCDPGYLVKRNSRTGQKLATKKYSEAWEPWLAAGWIWFGNFKNGLLRTRPF